MSGTRMEGKGFGRERASLGAEAVFRREQRDRRTWPDKTARDSTMTATDLTVGALPADDRPDATVSV